MARVNIEEGAFAKAERAARRLGMDPDLLTGKLARLWHQSQAEEECVATVEDIGTWMRLDPEIEEDVVEAILRVGLLELVEGGYLIRGNEKHIERLRSLRDNARTNGKLGGRPKKPMSVSSKNQYEKPVSVSSQNQYEKPVSVTNQNQLANHNTVQCSTEQYNSEQNSTEQQEAKASTADVRRATEPRGAVAELSGDEGVEGVLGNVTERTQRDWLKLYPEPDWVRSEILKAVIYYRDNPRKAPKKPAGWSRALTAWLDRSWSWRARTIPGAKAREDPFDALRKEVGQ